MRTWFIDGGTVRGDLVMSSAIFVAAVATGAIALRSGWYPSNVADYLLVAVAGATAWPLARVLPRTTLVLAGVFVAWPWWYFDSIELWMLPLLLAAFRCALAGVRATTLVVVSVVPVLTILYPGLWATMEDVFLGYGFSVFLLDPSRRILAVVVYVVVVTLGASLRLHRLQAAELRAQNEQLRVLRAADDERVAQRVRADVAKDIHDVVAHHVSAIVIQAQTAERLAHDDPPRVRATLDGITEEGRAALTAMRGLVRMLRGVPQSRQEGESSSLDVIVATMARRLSGAGIDVEVSLQRTEAPEFVEAAIAKIIQEALTNIMLHAHAQRVRIGLEHDGDTVVLRVTDDGRAPDAVTPRGGNGLVGMYERAAAIGGTLHAGPSQDGGWIVSATFPRLDARVGP